MSEDSFFEQSGVRFYTGLTVFVPAETRFVTSEFRKFLGDLGQKIRDDQIAGSDGEKIIEAAGRGCYLSYGEGRPTEVFLQNIMVSGHGEVTRHATVTFAIMGVSRGLTHELVRHGVGTAVSQVSSRYVDARQLGFVIPYHYRGNESLTEAFVKHCLESLELYEHHRVEMAGYLKTANLTWTKSRLRKEARGAARELLPVGLAQILFMSFNVQSCRHLLRLRGNTYNDPQIRDLARVIALHARRLWPEACGDIRVAFVEGEGQEIVTLDSGV